MPKQVVKKIISLQSNFFCSVKDNGKTIPLIKWDIIQRPKWMGSLGVRGVVLKNAAMLFKWRWRFSNKNLALWKNVVCLCYNFYANRTLINQAIRRKWGLWGAINDIYKMDKCLEMLVSNGISSRIGCGDSTYF